MSTLQDSIGSAEFTEWQEFAAREPPPAARLEAQLAIGFAAVLRALGCKGVRVDSLIPRFASHNPKLDKARARYYQLVAFEQARKQSERGRPRGK